MELLRKNIDLRFGKILTSTKTKMAMQRLNVKLVGGCLMVQARKELLISRIISEFAKEKEMELNQLSLNLLDN